MEIGAHTANHLFLPAQSAVAKVHEMASNRDYLQTLLRRSVTSFAYPYGAYDAESIAACRALGFHTAVTVVSQSVWPSHDPLALPRVEVTQTSQTEFESMLETAVIL
jgi:peptidoglycan/xylan/chitin deacetylase (PgdA/CDA1 family)